MNNIFTVITVTYGVPAIAIMYLTRNETDEVMKAAVQALWSVVYMILLFGFMTIRDAV